MKNIFLFIFILLPSILISQNQSDPLEGMSGIQQNENLFFEIKGYSINIVTVDKKFNDKEINKILKKYDIKEIQKQYSDPNLGRANVVIEDESESKEYPSAVLFQKFYFFPVGEKKTQFICFQNALSRDTVLELSFIEAFNNNVLDKYIDYKDFSPISIDFIGRDIKLGARCNWMFVNNLQCPGNGQMNWSVFPTMEEAQKKTDLQQLDSSSRKILKNEKINIIFEETPTVATRIVYKFNIPRFVMGGSNLLAVYYVTAEVRGKYISCILSNYVDSENDYTLGALLHEVMSLDKKE